MFVITNYLCSAQAEIWPICRDIEASLQILLPGSCCIILAETIIVAFLLKLHHRFQATLPTHWYCVLDGLFCGTYVAETDRGSIGEIPNLSGFGIRQVESSHRGRRTGPERVGPVEAILPGLGSSDVS